MTEQEHECRELCERNGWDVDDVIYSDNDTGASKRSKKKRVGYADLVKRIERGGADYLVAWSEDRITRTRVETAQLIDVLEGVACKVATAGGQVYDLTIEKDVFTFSLQGNLAASEAGNTSERIKRATRAQAREGKPHGPKLWGYDRVYDDATGNLIGQVPNAEIAVIVRWMYSSYVDGGMSNRAIADSLNERGILTRKGNTWSNQTVRQSLLNPGYAGLRVHRGEVVGEAAWEPIVSVEMFEAVKERMAANCMRGASTNRNARLLSGVTRCGVCGGKAVAKQQSLKQAGGRKHYYSYGCKTNFCASRNQQKLDDYVTAELLSYLGRDLGRVSGDIDEDEAQAIEAAKAEVEELRSRHDELKAAYTRQEIDLSTFIDLEGPLKHEITETERKTKTKVRKTIKIADHVVGLDSLEQWWHEELTPEQRRSLIPDAIRAVVIYPVRGKKQAPRVAAKGGKKLGHALDTNSVSIEWA